MDGAGTLLAKEPHGHVRLRELTLACLNELLAWHQTHHAELSEHWSPLYDLRDRLGQIPWQIVVLGRVSRGKSALLNALYGEIIFPVGAVHGTTQWPRTVRWHLDHHVVDLTDTPGLDEVAGTEREAMTWGAVATADLVLLVTDDSLTAVEMAASQELEARGIPYRWVVTKADLGAVAPAPLSNVSVVSSTTGQGMSELRTHLHEWLSHHALAARMTHVLQQASTIEQAVGAALANQSRSRQLPWPWLGGQLLGSALLPGAGDVLLAMVVTLGYLRHQCRAYGLPFPLPAFGGMSQFLLLWYAAIYVTSWSGFSMGAELWSINAPLVFQGAVILWGYQQLRHRLDSYLQQGYQWGRLGPQRLLGQMAQTRANVTASG
ncbi:Era-like GTP-binding protein [Thermosynechococcaceae cyanobacterium Okahandja]